MHKLYRSKNSLINGFLNLIAHYGLILCFLMITSCTTRYEIIPPSTAEGRKCANEYLLEKERCMQSCDMYNTQCNLLNQLNAQNNYLISQQAAKSNKDNKYMQHFSSHQNNLCNNSSCSWRCIENYHICHKNCGGEIIVIK